MEPSRDGTSWMLEETGEPFTWTAGEHCLVLTGYDCTVGVERKELRSGGGGTGSAVS